MTARDELAVLLANHESMGCGCCAYGPATPEQSKAADVLEVSDYMVVLADAILAAGYRKPRTITTAEELDALPVGSVVLSEGYTHHANEMPISFQRWTDGAWHRGARTGDTHPDNFLPATVLLEGAQS